MNIDPDSHAPMSNVEHTHTVGASRDYGSEGTPSALAAASPPTPVIDHPPLPPPKNTARHISDLSATMPTTSSQSSPLSGAGITSRTTDTIPNTGLAPDSVLAVEEARFLRGLYDRNAPAEEIAELMQAMRARQEATSLAARPSRHAINAEPGVSSEGAPPAYDFIS
jgi:hypothetical protein